MRPAPRGAPGGVLLLTGVGLLPLALLEKERGRGKEERGALLGNVAEIQNFQRITKINLWSNLATRGRGVHLHTLVDR